MQTVLSDKPEIELLEGRAYPKVSPKLTHSLVQGAAVVIVRRCVAGRGRVGPELRCHVGPGTELVPDVAYVSFNRLRPLSDEDREEPPFAPDVAIEVRSPSNRAAYDAKKVAKYLAHGSLLVLDIDPATRTLYAHANGTTVREYRAGEQFEHAAVSWLRFEIDELFADLKFP